ncbi:xaa-Arg dipeptidase-like [Glandiceps talaboti]
MATSDCQNLAAAAIDKAEKELFQISQELWKHPELEFDEKRAHDVLTVFLEKHGFDVERNFIHPTGFRAVYGSGGLNICVLCEFDALPEIGHGSGRNLVTECSLAVALALKATIEHCKKLNKPLGKVTVIGSPAEESGGGKIDMISAGVFENVDIALRAQPHHNNLSKPVMLDMLQMKVAYNGKPTHGALPWEGRNALDAAVLCYNNLAALRQQIKPSMQINESMRQTLITSNVAFTESIRQTLITSNVAFTESMRQTLITSNVTLESIRQTLITSNVAQHSL